MSLLSSLFDLPVTPWIALCAGLLLITDSQGRTPPAEPEAPPLPDWQPPRLVLPAPARLPVRLERVAIDSEVQGRQALTRVELVFYNPNERVLEGELQFPLLDGQQVVGLALEVDGRLRDAVPVEKAKGRQVFEDVIRRQIDPALLEATAGNNYKLRLYPIPARGGKRVVLRILENLPLEQNQATLRLPLGYADSLERLDLSVRVFSDQQPLVQAGDLVFTRKGEIYEAHLNREQYRGRDLVRIQVPAARQAQAASQVLDGTTWFRAEIPAPAVQPQPRPLPRRVLLLWDASGSLAGRDRTRELALLDRYFRHMTQGEVDLVRFRDTPEPARTFQVTGGDWTELRRALEATDYDGATRLDLLTPVAGAQEALLFSDGLANYGDGTLPDLKLPTFCISARPGADSAALGLLARRSGGRYLDLARLADPEADALLLTQPAELVSLGGQGVSQLVSESNLPVDGRFLVAGAATGGEPRLEAGLRLPDGSLQQVQVPIPAPSDAALAGLTWARLRLAELAGERDLRRAEIRRLGRRFRLPTPETSLIVLDRVEDYAQHLIEPPPELKDAYERLLESDQARESREHTAHLERVVALFRDKQAWWDKDFPKGPPPAPKAEKQAPVAGLMVRSPAPMMAAPPSPEPGESLADFDLMESAAPAAEAAPPPAPGDEGAGPAVAIALKKWRSDAPYMDRFRSAADADLYRIYLDERPDWTDSSAFFLDAADLLLERGRTALGLRVLSNLAEMDLENRQLLRILAYRLVQAGYPKLALPVFRQVLELAPDEPQSWRDLGLAHQAAGQLQEALDHLYRVVERAWSERFPEIELIALAELNALVATSDRPLDTSAVDPRLLRNLPLDLRVILTWDADNSDMDLWVTDPNGEKSYYGNRLSYQGGRMSPDFTTGYGPEEYSLKRAKPGRYLVQANFYGHSQQLVAGATTLQLDLFTRYATREQQRQSVTLRLKGEKDVVTVGEFVVGEQGVEQAR